MKQSKKRHNQAPTRHHLLPTSKGGNSHHNNINWIERVKHEAIHTLFQNLTPHEQLEELMLNINITALSEEFKEDVRIILSESDNRYYYDKGIYKLKHLRTLNK